MKKGTPGRVRLAVLTGALVVAALLAAGMGALRAEDETSADKPKTPPKLEVGKPAPDFELPLMKSETNDEGEKTWRITDETVRLSSFRGEKVVVVFMSSYT